MGVHFNTIVELMLDSYKENGFVVIKNLIEVNQLNLIRLEMENLFSKFALEGDSIDAKLFNLFRNDISCYKNVANACQYLISLYSLCSCNQVLINLINLGITKPIVNTRPLVSFSSRLLAINEFYWKVPAHQDWPSTQGSLDSVTLWLPLVDVTEEMGALQVVPGSHLQGLLSHKDETVPQIIDEDKDWAWKSIPLQMGDAIFMSSFLVHRSGNNITDKIRWATHFRYDNADEPTFIERQYPKHRVDQRCRGLLSPNFPDKEQVRRIFQ